MKRMRKEVIAAVFVILLVLLVSFDSSPKYPENYFTWQDRFHNGKK